MISISKENLRDCFSRYRDT